MCARVQRRLNTITYVIKIFNVLQSEHYLVQVQMLKTCTLKLMITQEEIAFHFRLKRLGSRVVTVLDLKRVGPGFKSQPRRCRVTVLGKLFSSIVPLFTKQRNW